jgi:hypothetical protein
MKLHSGLYCVCISYVRVNKYAHINSRCDVHLLLFQCLTEHLGNPLRIQVAVSCIRGYRQHSLVRTDNFAWYCMLRTVIIMLNHFIIAIRWALSDAVRGLSLCCLSVRVAYLWLCIANTYSPVSNFACTQVPRDRCHSPTDVSRWNVFSSHELTHFHDIYFALTLSLYTKLRI